MSSTRARARLEGNFDLSGIKQSVKVNLRELALAVVKEAQLRCPVGKTGHLRDSIHAEETPGGYVVAVDDPIAPHVEFGHAEVKNGKHVGHVPAHPFLRPAMIKAAQDFGAEVGSAAGSSLGGSALSELGPAGVRIGQAVGGRIGYRVGSKYGRMLGVMAADYATGAAEGV